MKKLLLFLLLAASSQVLSAQWNAIYNHSDQEVGTAVLNADTIITITQAGGRIHRSTDGGQTWSFYQTIFTSEWFTDLHFPSDQVGYACGGTAFGNHTNFIAKTIDGGITWDSLTSNNYPTMGMSFTCIHFADELVGFVAGETGEILKTTDGGLTFAPMTLPIGSGFYIGDIFFTSPQVGYVAATSIFWGSGRDENAILKTTDQGVTWDVVFVDTLWFSTPDTQRFIRQIHAVDDNTVYAVGDNGTFVKTMDGGQTWELQTLFPYNTLSTVHFTDANTGYTNLAGIVQKTVDGGATWSPQQSNPSALLSQIAMANDSVGFFIGSSSTFGGVSVFKTSNSGGTILGVEQQTKEEDWTLYPNPSKGIFKIKGKEMPNFEQVEVFDVTGKSVLKINYTSGMELDLTSLSPGTYWVKMLCCYEMLKAKKVVVMP